MEATGSALRPVMVSRLILSVVACYLPTYMCACVVLTLFFAGPNLAFVLLDLMVFLQPTSSKGGALRPFVVSQLRLAGKT